MVRAERAMVMATKREMASNDNNDNHDNDNDRDNNCDEDNSGNEDDNTSATNDDKDDGDDYEKEEGAAVVAGSFVSSGSVSRGNCGGIGGSSFGRWRVAAVVGVVVCCITTARRSVHNNQPKEGCLVRNSDFWFRFLGPPS
jgi:hypothetical protein